MVDANDSREFLLRLSHTPTWHGFLDNPDQKGQRKERISGDYDEIEIAIKAVFGGPDEERQAEERLSRLRQDRSAATCAAGFRQQSVRALMHASCEELKGCVKDELYRIDRPDTLDAYIEEAVRIYNRQYERE
ncbi:hypothetical protein MMYC01_207891 [Madurella mycetomatis]|uniref:Uncharacterized protein n=1 Tax=Madurella mycetomatis TaxID=100816 RepID=A0A175VXZ2_9PEZI|nr:hypothetical protein MMYC01_207891 [Madurella mycetomatis]